MVASQPKQGQQVPQLQLVQLVSCVVAPYNVVTVHEGKNKQQKSHATTTLATSGSFTGAPQRSLLIASIKKKEVKRHILRIVESKR